MKIQETVPTHSTLAQIGIQIKELKSTTPQNPKTNELNPREEFQLSGLKLQDFDQAYLVQEDGETHALPLDPKVLQQSKLLEALQKVHQTPSLDHALDVNSNARDLISAMRKAHGLNDNTPLQFIISGAFGALELDLTKLDPVALKRAFEGHMLQTSPTELLDQHQDIAGLSQRVRAGFGHFEAQSKSIADLWTGLIENQALDIEHLLSQAFGFNPYNEEATVLALLEALENHPLEPTANRKIDDQVKALIELANRLEQDLDLAPAPNTPDIMNLLRDFLAIIQELDHAINALINEQGQKQKLERRILAGYAELLHSNLHFHQEQLNKLQASGKDKLKLLINQALTQTRSRTWVAMHAGDKEIQNELRVFYGDLKKQTTALEKSA